MNQKEKARNLALEFISVSREFRLGGLPTESPHAGTVNLSHESKHSITKAIESIQAIDREVFLKLQQSLLELNNLKDDIAKTLKSNGRIFLCGCGATGRLSLALETLWRQKYNSQDDLVQKVISFMAGGDVALIHSVEKFEDFPEYGERQLKELGFREGDLLISCTEGGETPFVIGATEAAAKISKRSPYFLYCNPDDILLETAARSKKVIENDQIKKMNLTVGPMALTGSTRMQATTILMYAVGLSLWFYDQDFSELKAELNRMISFMDETCFDFLKPFIECESDLYKKGEYLLYETDGKLGISIMTDTTERSPTFSLYPFENQDDVNKLPSLSYLYFPHATCGSEAWEELLGRAPRTFHWSEVTADTSEQRLMGFDFSKTLLDKRATYLTAPHRHFKIFFDENANALILNLMNHTHVIQLKDLNFLSAHLVLKMALNNLSTLVMGRLDRYESNLMTWVRASNNKLVDRTVRYVDTLLKQRGITVPYEELVHACFSMKDQIPRDQSLVMALVAEFTPHP
jgi:N-acetylmuramic acid 6-phosphate etherase